MIKGSISYQKDTFLITDITKIDWQKQYKFVIKRVLECGNDDEKKKSSNSTVEIKSRK